MSIIGDYLSNFCLALTWRQILLLFEIVPRIVLGIIVPHLSTGIAAVKYPSGHDDWQEDPGVLVNGIEFINLFEQGTGSGKIVGIKDDNIALGKVRLGGASSIANRLDQRTAYLVLEADGDVDLDLLTIVMDKGKISAAVGGSSFRMHCPRRSRRRRCLASLTGGGTAIADTTLTLTYGLLSEGYCFLLWLLGHDCDRCIGQKPLLRLRTPFFLS